MLAWNKKGFVNKLWIVNFGSIELLKPSSTSQIYTFPRIFAN
jgi:hypothetical protein